MFADPQSVTVNAVAKSMPRIETKGNSSTYIKDDQTFKLTISHQQSGKRIRSMVRIDQRAIVPDPLTSVNDYETLSFYFVIDRPEVGFSSTEVNYLCQGLVTWLDSTAVGKLFGLQS
ncbi:TPA_asm: coat protein [ssRNA phage ESO000]|uniref:Coat protein n=1 Tax=ssRNA phage ESO000 TaxID=2786007 RepID=A0A8S5KXP1_9VIRU|nr:coat protein [ssRNA phage ESO000]DAD49916.1 TPA_asm: coat protein [ssRNA phage ESO000]